MRRRRERPYTPREAHDARPAAVPRAPRGEPLPPPAPVRARATGGFPRLFYASLAAVIGVPDEKWGESVKAVVALKEGVDTSETELIEWTRERLAHFKAPRSVDIIEALGEGCRILWLEDVRAVGSVELMKLGTTSVTTKTETNAASTRSDPSLIMGANHSATTLLSALAKVLPMPIAIDTDVNGWVRGFALTGAATAGLSETRTAMAGGIDYGLLYEAPGSWVPSGWRFQAGLVWRDIGTTPFFVGSKTSRNRRVAPLPNNQVLGIGIAGHAKYLAPALALQTTQEVLTGGAHGPMPYAHRVLDWGPAPAAPAARRRSRGPRSASAWRAAVRRLGRRGEEARSAG